MRSGASAAVAILVLLFSWTLTTHGKYSVSGDEPHYLIVAESLRSDGDLDLANNYAHDDARLFGHSGLEMGPHARISRTGRLRSVHDIGLPILVLPVYAVAQQVAALPSERLLQRVRMTRGLFAYSVVALFLIVALAFGMFLYAGAVHAWTGTAVAAFVAGAAAISPPIVSYTFLVFPETVALFVTLLVVWYALSDTPQSIWRTLGIALALGLLPWVHRKYSFFVFGLLFVILVKQQASLRRLSPAARTAALTLFLLPQLTLHLWTWHEWGTLGGPQMVDSVPFSAASLAAGLTGLLLDRVHGVLAYGPLYLMAPACCWLERKRTWPFLAAAALLYVPMAAFIDWPGGFSTAARYVVPALPLVLVPMVAATRRPAVRMVFLALMIPQAIIDAVVWQHPRTLWPAAPASNAALERIGAAGRLYERMLPSIWTDGVTLDAGVLLAAIVLASAAVVAFVHMRETRTPGLSVTI